jgi:hypothetical protein
MFRRLPIPEDAPARVDQPAEDEIIHKALTAIIGKWRGRGMAETLPESHPGESGMMETIILSPSDIAAPVSPVRDEEEWTETVVLSARGLITEPPPFSPRNPEGDAFLETVALSAGGVKTEQSTAAPPYEGEDAVLETVIMSPGVRPERTFGEKNGHDAGPKGERKEEAANGDAVPETVIINPQKAKVKAKGWKD